MGFAFPNGGVVDAHDVPRSQPGKLRDLASYGKRWFVVGPYHRLKPAVKTFTN